MSESDIFDFMATMENPTRADFVDSIQREHYRLARIENARKSKVSLPIEIKTNSSTGICERRFYL